MVVGGGLVGLAASVVLARTGRRVLHVAPTTPPDRRTSALMQPSVAYLSATGLLDDPASIGHPLTQIRIIDATHRLVRAPETLFDSAEIGLPAFGWNLPNAALAPRFTAVRDGLPHLSTRAASLTDLVRIEGHWQLTLSDGTTVTTPLLIGADGKTSRVREAAGFRVREHGFKQAALVCDLTLGRPLGGTSVEFHYENGPFTLVPAGGNRANLVWIDRHDTLRAAQAEGREALAARFTAKAQNLFGPIELATPTHMFLLSTLAVPEAGRDGAVLLGEAAHAFPPIGAQGLNLGLRDVADLAAALATSDDPSAIAAAYSHRRTVDLLRTGTFVDTLFRSLLSDFLPAQATRAGGLWALKLIPALRRRAFALGMGEG